MNKNRLYGKFSISLLLFILCLGGEAKAQLTGLYASYFQNQYLANPAMAGIDKGLNLNLGVQHQWTNIPGGPQLQNITADYYAGSRVGLGFAVNAGEEGLINRTRIAGTYAYHVPLSLTGKLNFGFTLSMNQSFIDYTKVSGDQGDMQAQNYNHRGIYADADVGVSYTTSRLTLQGTLPNLKSLVFPATDQGLDVDRETFYSAISYKFPLSDEINRISLEPKLAYRGIKGFNNILDAGADLVLVNYHLDFSGIYHSDKSLTCGLGFTLQHGSILLAYTNDTVPLRTVANNSFEIGLRWKLLDRAKP